MNFIQPGHVVIYFVAAGLSALVLSRSPRIPRITRWLVMAIFFVVLLLLPVQIASVMQFNGLAGAAQFRTLVYLQSALLGAICIWRSTRRLLPSHLEPDVEPRPNRHCVPPYIIASAIILAGTYVLLGCELVTSYPDGWDTLAYHLPTSLRFLQEGTLQLPASKVWQYSLPANVEICMALILRGGIQALAPLVNCLALFILGCSVYVIARWFCGVGRSALVITLIVVSIPIIQFQAFSGYVDLFGTAFMCAAVALFLLRKQCPGRPSSAAGRRLNFALLGLSAMACGVSLGTKPIYYVYGGVYLVLTTIVLFAEERRVDRLLVGAVGTMVAGMLIPAAFWPYRNAMATRNPVYPLQVRVAGHVLLDGYTPESITPADFERDYVRSRWGWAVYPWTESKRTRGFQDMAYSEGSGVGGAFATFIPVGLLFAVSNYLRRARTRWRPQGLLLPTWCALLAVWWFALHREPRFGLPLWVLACILSAPLVTLMLRYHSRIFQSLLVASVGVTCIVTASAPVHLMLGRIRSGDYSRAAYYEYPKVIDNLPDGSRILNYTGSYSNNFALAGARLSNRVIAYFEAPQPPGGQLFIDPSQAGRQLTSGFLREHRVDFVLEIARGDASPPVNGLQLFSDVVLRSDESPRHWRIWKVPATL